MKLDFGGVKFAIFINPCPTEKQEHELLKLENAKEVGSSHAQDIKVVFHFDSLNNIQENYAKCEENIKQVMEDCL